MKAIKVLTTILSLVIIAALSILLYFTYTKSQKEIATLKDEIVELKSENESLGSKLYSTDTKLNNLQTKYDSAEEQIESISKSLIIYQNEAKMWKNKYLGIDNDNSNLPTSFASTKELVSAIRTNPTQYADKTVTVIGTFYVYNGEKGIFDMPLNTNDVIFASEFDSIGVKLRYYINQSNINTIFQSSSLSTVLRSGDYIKITGVVAIDSDVYLKDCNYELVQLRENRYPSINIKY
jgi:hypothetical protein